MMRVLYHIILLLKINFFVFKFCSNTYSKVQEKSDTVWKIQRYHLIRQYSSALAPPLNSLGYFIIKPLDLFRLWNEKIKSKQNKANTQYNKQKDNKKALEKK